MLISTKDAAFLIVEEEIASLALAMTEGGGVCTLAHAMTGIVRLAMTEKRR